MDNMQIVRLSDGNNYKCDTLKKIGIKVDNHSYGDKTIYEVSIKDMPDADKCFETTFNSINDILLAFKDILFNKQIRVVTA